MARVKVTGSTAALKGKAKQASNRAMRAVASELNSRFQDAMGARVWEWDNVTIRSNKKPVGTPRTIVDTGRLRQSNSFTVTGNVAIFRWSEPYASAIHEGAILLNGGIIKPRPWTDAVLGVVSVSGVEPYDYRKALFDKWLNHFQQ